MNKIGIFLMVMFTAIVLSGCASIDDIPSTNDSFHSSHTGGRSGGGSCH